MSLHARNVNVVILALEMTGPVGIQAADYPGGWRNLALYAEPKECLISHSVKMFNQSTTGWYYKLVWERGGTPASLYVFGKEPTGCFG